MKKILFLGAAAFQLPPIQYALSKGYRVITADNCPKNPLHELAEASYDVSTTDKEGILEVAQKEQVDGIMTFASDVSMPAVAYAGAKMGLPAPDYQTVLTLTNKALFREFLQREGLQYQVFRIFQAEELEEAIAYIQAIRKPIVVKPVDRSGSRGVSIVWSSDWAEKAVKDAFRVSLKKEIIVEEYVQKVEKQVCGDGYMEDGKLLFVAFGDGHFYDDMPFMAPYGETFPSLHDPKILEEVRGKLEEVLQKVGYHRGPFNLDVLITKDEGVFINEIGPRCGGNYIPKLIELRHKFNLVEAAVEGCLDGDYKVSMPKSIMPSGYYASYMIHSQRSGSLKTIRIDNSLKSKIYAYHPYMDKQHHYVEKFCQAGAAMGNVIFEFDSNKEMYDTMRKINQLYQVIVKEEEMKR